MFRTGRKHSRIRELRPVDEKKLVSELAKSPDENVYLLGLLRDYTFRTLNHMRWGRFFAAERGDRYDGIFYVDAAGLLIVSGASTESIEDFARYCSDRKTYINRIISLADQTDQMNRSLLEIDKNPREVWQRFSEEGMILFPDQVSKSCEPRLRLAELSDSQRIAEGAALAMAEELNIETGDDDFARLLSSKNDLIERSRYYLLEEEGHIVFQAYFSAFLPEVSQIQGVWVPPSKRGQAVATRCVAEMCRRSFKSTRRIVLRVQKRNIPAIRVYEKVGFERFREYLSIWYKSRNQWGTKKS